MYGCDNLKAEDIDTLMCVFRLKEDPPDTERTVCWKNATHIQIAGIDEPTTYGELNNYFMMKMHGSSVWEQCYK